MKTYNLTMKEKNQRNYHTTFAAPSVEFLQRSFTIHGECEYNNFSAAVLLLVWLAQ